jgi:hypothetical protein
MKRETKLLITSKPALHIELMRSMLGLSVLLVFKQLDNMLVALTHSVYLSTNIKLTPQFQPQVSTSHSQLPTHNSLLRQEFFLVKASKKINFHLVEPSQASIWPRKSPCFMAGEPHPHRESTNLMKWSESITPMNQSQ